MRKFILITGLLLALAGYYACQEKAPTQASAQTPEKEIAQMLIKQVDSFELVCGQLDSAMGKDSVDARAQTGKKDAVGEALLQRLFLQARLAYKRFEWAAEYFEPTASRLVNGPPVAEVESGSGQVLEPAGLQVMEGYLFPRYDTTQRAALRRQLALIKPRCSKFRSHFANIDIFDWQVFDAAKLEVFRVETLGITGFDNPLTLRSAQESDAALSSLRGVLAHYGDLSPLFDAASLYLNGHVDFNAFDRADFILAYCNPLTRGISDLETRLKIHVIRYNRLLNQDARTLFDTNAFNVNAYSPDPSSFMTDEKVALGKVLFADASLSGTGTRSCQSCHQPDKAFTDGLVKNTILGDKRMLKRNTPTLINAALQPSQFYDMRVNTLEDQSRTVVQNIEEMHGAMSLSVGRLWQDSRYRALFSKAFPKKDRTGIDTLEVMNALGSYVRSLTLLNSRFDAYMRGEKTALSESEVSGFNIFMGKAKCATCHYMPLFNGTFPPRFIRTESEVIGVPIAAGVAQVDADMGRYDVVHFEGFRYAFKTPTVRNVARTAPYMHNGVFGSIEEVVDFYDKGGGRGMGIHLANQTLPFDKLALTAKEKADLAAFLRSLNSRYQ